MPTFRLNVSVKTKGVIFDGSKSKAAAKRAMIEANDLLALEAKSRIDARLKNVLRNPTGYYQSRIEVERRSVYRGVTDSRVPYGGWLEGVDRRNKTTRFKGYKTFRLVKQSMNQDKDRIIAPVLKKLTGNLQG